MCGWYSVAQYRTILAGGFCVLADPKFTYRLLIMARFGILVGVLLCANTAMGLFTSMDKSTCQFFPMMIGIPILFLAVVGLNPHRRRASTMLAAAITLFALLVGGVLLARTGLSFGDDQPRDGQIVRVIGAMWGLSLIYFLALVRWILKRIGRKSVTSSPIGLSQD